MNYEQKWQDEVRARMAAEAREREAWAAFRKLVRKWRDEMSALLEEAKP